MKGKTQGKGYDDLDLIVCNHFRLVKKLGTGAFGEIYLAENKNNASEKYAAKLEETNTKFPQLYFEAKMYKYLNSSGSVQGIPKVHAVTTEGQYNVMLMDLLGSSVEDIFVDNNKIMSVKSAIMIGYQMIERIQYLHERQIIHRDIKPDNFLMGINNNAHLLYIVDFGLSKKYIKDNKHIPYREGKQLTGTARYASISTHMGIEQSRRDDIESIGYVIMYLLRGILPWQNMKAKDTKTKYKMIMQKKIATPAEILCKGYPGEMATFINYARNIKFEDKPDYAYIKNLLKSALKQNNLEMDFVYDWSKKGAKQKKKNEEVSEQKVENIVEEKVEMKKEEPKESGHGMLKGSLNTGMYNPRNKVAGNNNKPSVNSSNNNIKGTSNGNQQPKLQLQSVMGQKLSGPKISTVKR